ncbi:PKD domain-containing protein [bacterium]|nr:PKD domain-containing protein [bacterium]MCI0606760.1 PKD domain-containing protein [bacterium]
MKSKLRAGTPMIALAFIGIAVLFIASCSTDEVDIPDLTGPSGTRLFITIEASPDSVFIRKPSATPDRSNITIQLKNQLGAGVPNARIKLRLTNIEGSEVGIGSLDANTVVTDSGGFARVTYTAPSTAEQPVNTRVFITAILTDPAYPFEVVTRHPLDLELTKPFDCVAGPGAPEISFTITPASPAEDEQVCFDAQGTVDNGTIISFSWTFGDGGSSSGVFVCHTYTSNGSFPVTLFVVDDDANCVSLTRLVEVNEGDEPTCDFTISPNPVSTDTQVFFDASTSEDPDGNIVSFQWNFGDGSTASGEKVTHSYNFTGTFTVSLTIRDNAGNEVVCTQTVSVGTGFPTCTFDFTPSDPDTETVVSFDGSASTDPEGGVLTFDWDFADGGTDTGPVVTHQFLTEGSFIVELTVTDPEGNATQCTEAVVVGEAPVPTCTFDSDPNPSCTGQNVTFDASASDPNDTVLTFEWDFDCTNPPNPDTVDSTQGPIAITSFPTAGIVDVCLRVTNDDASTQVCSRPQVVTEAPDIDDANPFDPDSGAIGDAVQIFGSGFVSAANGGALSFGTQDQPSFTVNGPGTVITTTVPAGATDGPITFTNDCGGDVSNVDFDVEETMSISNGVPSPANEGVAITFTVTLSSARSVQTDVDFATGGGNATGAAVCNGTTDDYESEAGTLSIPAGSTTGDIVVNTCADTDTPEVQETFNVTLSNPSAGVTITDNQGVGSIADVP